MKIIEVAGVDALAELHRLIGQAENGGPWPILLGGEESLENHQGSLEFNRAEYGSTEVVLKQAENIDVQKWFAERKSDEPELYDNLDSPIGPSEIQPSPGIITHLKLSNDKPMKRVFIALFEVSRPADVFAHLFWGGWNDCPDAQVQVAMHRHWEEAYGARVVSITHNVVQCLASRPPQSGDDAMRLADEQFLYCPDIVIQGTGTIENLAASLVGAEGWYFWWD
jgi:hypothetical protein